MSQENARKLSLQGWAVVVGWVSTLAILVWTLSTKSTTYEYRLDTIERELVSLDGRVDAAEDFRTSISTDLAEIKTDLLWIRYQIDKSMGGDD
jgi:septal ring factor EnvC (AmiA/AmiB activator)